MDTIKVEGEDLPLEEENDLGCDKCFICLQKVLQISEEQFNSLNFFFNYLKINDQIKEAFVCEKCEEKLKKVEKICGILEKARLELDYLLEAVQSAISNSDGDSNWERILLRKAVAEKCGEKTLCRKLKIIIKRLKPEKFPDQGPPIEPSFTGYFNDLFGDLGDVSSSRDLESLDDNLATPVIIEVDDMKMEANLDAPPNGNRKRKGSTGSTSKTRKTFKHPTKSFKCSTCLKVFSRSDHLRRHFKLVHLRLKPYKCDICDKTFVNLSAFRLHKASPHHPAPQNSKRFLCEKCEKTFPTIESWKNHERYVHSEKCKIFTCDICNKEFKKTDHLKRHVSAVHDKQRHHCQVPGCGKSYSQAGLLVNHCRLEHPTSFPEKSPKVDYLEKVNNGESFTECKLCKSKFETVVAVKRHIRRVHEPKKFKCQECGYAATTNTRLERHLKQMHKVLNVVKVRNVRK